MSQRLHTIDSTRFILAILVVFIHMTDRGLIISPTNSTHPIYTFIDQGFMPYLTTLAIPGFFILSGYLFFTGFNAWDWSRYRTKIGSRLHTLLIPFFLWNLMKYASLVLIEFPHLGSNTYFHVFREYGSLRMFWDGNAELSSPILLSTWFLRDLFILCTLSPIFYFVIKKSHGWIILCLIMLTSWNFWPTHNICNATNVLSFACGATISIFHRDLLQTIEEHQHSLYIIAVVSLFSLFIFETNFAHIIYMLAGNGCLISILLHLHKHKLDIPQHLCRSSMTIYLGHTFLTLSLTTHIIDKLLPFPGDTFSTIRYFLIITATILFLILFDHIIRKYTPRLSRLLLGNR